MVKIERETFNQDQVEQHSSQKLRENSLHAQTETNKMFMFLLMTISALFLSVY